MKERKKKERKKKERKEWKDIKKEISIANVLYISSSSSYRAGSTMSCR